MKVLIVAKTRMGEWCVYRRDYRGQVKASDLSRSMKIHTMEQIANTRSEQVWEDFL